MNKKIKSLIGAAVLVMALPLQGLAAADAAASLQPAAGGAEVSLKLQDGAGEGVNALQMSFTLSPVAGSLDKADVSFVFHEDLAGTVKRYRYDQEEKVLTVYVAGADGKLFHKDEADLGTIQVEAAEGEYLELSITTGLPVEGEHPDQELATGLTLLRAGSSQQELTMQAEAVQVNVGEMSPDPDPTEKPEATEQPEATQKPETTEQPQPTEKPQATEKPQPTEKPSGGNNGGGNNGSNPTVPGTAVQPGSTASSKAPAASSQSAVSEISSGESESRSQAASSEAESQAAESESQAQSQSTASQTQKSKVSVLPVVIGVAVVAAAAVAGVVIWRRGRD